MNKEISLRSLSHTAWTDFHKAWMSWILLAIAGNAVLGLVSVGVYYYLPEGYQYAADIAMVFLGAMYTAILYQNGLDAAYGRKLSFVTVSSQTLLASVLFFFIMLSYNPFFIPEYSEYLFFFLPQEFAFFMIVNLIVHLVLFYFIFRFIFAPMIVLHEKISIMDALRKSFRLTSHHLLFLLGLLMYLIFILIVSVVIIYLPSVLYNLEIIDYNMMSDSATMVESVLGYGYLIMAFMLHFAVVSYTILMKSLVFKQLNSKAK